MRSTFKPSAISLCLDLDQVLFLPRLGQLRTRRQLFLIRFCLSLLQIMYHIGLHIRIRRHTPVRTTEIWDFLISLKHFFHKIGMTDKFFALCFVGFFVLLFSSSIFFMWREMDPKRNWRGNAYAKFWGGKQRALVCYIFDIDGVVQSLPVWRAHISPISCYLVNYVTIALFPVKSL